MIEFLDVYFVNMFLKQNKKRGERHDEGIERELKETGRCWKEKSKKKNTEKAASFEMCFVDVIVL